MAQQTAVDWLIEQMIAKQNGKGDSRSMDEIFEESKKMEKQQIVNNHLTGLIHPLEIEATKQAEQYYNETYGK